MSRQFLQISDAARLLGVSTLRLREAVARGLVKARRDNEGRLRVDLDAAPGDLKDRLAEGVSSAEELLDALFDEIEDLQVQVATLEADGARMAELLDRQAEALDRTADALEASQRDAARLAGLLGRALDLIEALEAAPASAATDDPARDLLAQATADLEASRAESARLSELLERALAAAERAEIASGEGAGERAGELERTMARSMDLLDRAVADGEAAREDAGRLGGLLDRAMAAAERMEREAQESETVIAGQDGMLRRLFSLTERTVDLAASGRRPRRHGLLDRMFGR